MEDIMAYLEDKRDLVTSHSWQAYKMLLLCHSSPCMLAFRAKLLHSAARFQKQKGLLQSRPRVMKAEREAAITIRDPAPKSGHLSNAACPIIPFVDEQPGRPVDP
eukprot:123644-Pelagomonas_calceolata.AAC.3